MKFRPVGAESFHADGRTDTTKLLIAFRNFAKGPKKFFAKYTNIKFDEIPSSGG